MEKLNKTVDFGKGPKKRIKHTMAQTGTISGGNYNIQKPFGSDAPAIKIKGKLRSRPGNDNPAPTHYNPDDRQVEPNKGNLMTSRSQKIIFTERMPDAGMYQKVDTFGKDGKKVSMQGKGR